MILWWLCCCFVWFWVFRVWWWLLRLSLGRRSCWFVYCCFRRRWICIFWVICLGMCWVLVVVCGLMGRWSFCWCWSWCLSILCCVWISMVFVWWMIFLVRRLDSRLVMRCVFCMILGSLWMGSWLVRRVICLRIFEVIRLFGLRVRSLVVKLLGCLWVVWMIWFVIVMGSWVVIKLMVGWKLWLFVIWVMEWVMYVMLII